MEKVRCAIIGGSQSGKSFLASGFGRGLWNKYKMRSLVFDPWLKEPKHERTDWGPGAWVTGDFAQWKRVVCSVQGCCAIWDEATTHGGSDEENLPMFTEIRHRHPVLLAIGHSHSAILRGMRVNLTDLYLALSDDIDAMLWARTMKDPGLKRACDEKLMPKYHFMRKRPYVASEVVTFSKAQILGGILP